MRGRSASAGLEEKADRILKKANKWTVPSLLDFRFKPDWEQAAPLYEQAAVAYKESGCTEKALEAYERAATAQEKLSSLWHAAKHYEACGAICKLRADWERVAVFYRRAADAYVADNKATTGAEALVRGAKAIEEHDSDTAIHMSLEALDLYESEGKESMGVDAYRATISAMIRAKRYAEAAQTLMRLALACDQIGKSMRSSQCKAYLGAVVTLLYDRNGRHAWQTFQDAEEVAVFKESSESHAAKALLEAYRSGHDEEVKNAVNRFPAFRQLDSQVARLAVKLPMGNLAQIAAALDGLMAGGQEDDGSDGLGEEEDVM